MRRLLTLLALLAAAGAPATQEPSAAASELPASGESWTLFQGLYASRRLDLRVPTGLAERAAARLLKGFSREAGFAVQLNSDAPDPRAVRVLAGLPGDPALEPLARALGLEPAAGGFRLFERDYHAAGDALEAVFEDPARPGQPLCLILGNDLELLAFYLDEIPRLSRPFLRVWSDGELALDCPLETSGAPRVAFARDFLARRTQYFEDAPVLTQAGLTLHARNPPDAQQWKRYGFALTTVKKRVVAWLGASADPPAEIFLYEHAEDLEACLGESELSVVNRLHPRVHALLAPGMPDDGGGGLAWALARDLAGPPTARWMEDGIAVAAAGKWWQRPLDEWVARLAAGGILPDARDVMASDASERLSEHALAPARGFLFQRIMMTAGGDPRRARALWKGASTPPKKLLALYRSSVMKTLQGSKSVKAERLAGTRVREARLAKAPLRNGIALVDGPDASYSARAVGTALDRARELEPGPDAVSLTVLASAEDPSPPLCALDGRAVFGGASDVALASAVAEARKRDMRTLLALEVLAQPNGSWADGVSQLGAEEQARFWSRYTRVAVHYALLCELLRVEVLSLGSNLRDAARTEPQSDAFDPRMIAARRLGWSRLIQRVRAAFTGGLTYTARFPAEAEEVGFYDQLDFVGLALFPRLSGPERVPDDGELRRVQRLDVDEAIELALRWNKPLLLVQLGFPARSASWQRPSSPRGAPDPEAQQRFLEALADVLGSPLDNQDVLRGFYLWNWPVAEGARDASGFSLRANPAESALRRLFAR